MRLGDLNDLRNKILDNMYFIREEDNNQLTAVIKVDNLLEFIKNAPTACVDNYSMGYQDGVKKVLSEIQQVKETSDGER